MIRKRLHPLARLLGALFCVAVVAMRLPAHSEESPASAAPACETLSPQVKTEACPLEGGAL